MSDVSHCDRDGAKSLLCDDDGGIFHSSDSIARVRYTEGTKGDEVRKAMQKRTSFNGTI